jgi:WhiB family redox-sensing transcriptional regulator
MLEDMYTDMPNFSEHGDTACSKVDPELFFAKEYLLDDGISLGSAKYESEATAKKVCASCPYLMRCLEYALKNPDFKGIWGGTTERERYNLNRAIRRTGGTIEERIRYVKKR